MKNILVYVTGHGFGHASRTSQLLNCLAVMLPDAFFHIRTGAPEWYFRHLLDDCVRFEYSHAEIDIGVVQNGPLNLSKKKTLERFAVFWSSREDNAEREARLFRDRGISLIVADIPPLAFLTARKLGVPSVGVTNFTWDWIYADYVKCWPEYSYLIPEIENAYRNADQILRLPFAGPVPPGVSFDDVPLVARRPRKDREYVLSSLNIRREKPVVLISFGGFPLGNKLFRSLESLESYNLVTTFPSQGSIPSIHHITEEQIVLAGLRYTDIVNAVDMVAGKPGYGLVSECISCGKPLLYTSRGCFSEYWELVKGIKRHLRSVYIPKRDLLSGRWAPYLDELNHLEPPSLTCRTDGDRVVSEKLIEILQTGGKQHEQIEKL